MKTSPRPHPANPRGVLIQCAVCGRELHIPKNEAKRLDLSTATCSYDCAVTHATSDAALAARVRDEKIRIAHVNGVSIRAIAKAAGLSSARVHQILHGR